MPCSDNGQWEGEVTRRLDDATKAGCELAEHIERNSKVPLLNIMSISKETRKWVQQHRELDRLRILEEGKHAQKAKLKEQVLGKLTKEEKDALDIK